MKPWFPWPRTLASRLSLIFLAGLVLAYGLSFGAQYWERYLSSESMMHKTMERDVATGVAILDHLPADQRDAWIPRLERQVYTFELGDGAPGQPLPIAELPHAGQAILTGLNNSHGLNFTHTVDPRDRFQAHLRLNDGTPVTIDVHPSSMPIPQWLPVMLLIQLTVVWGCTWAAVRMATRPLTRLASAAEALDPNSAGQRLDLSGPSEVTHAASAFNAMQDRIATYLKERMQLLGAISHDLQTPLTRMKLRAEFMDDGVEKDKLWHDLSEMEHLVREGIAYARTLHGATEASCRIDLDAFLQSLVFDYQDVNQPVALASNSQAQVDTRPQALRRILSNLVDNALKFAGDVSLGSTRASDGSITIEVLDQGPGIAEEELQAVFKPFYRLENSRNRSTGGTGLGLAIAQQLTLAIGGQLTLSNREGGGLSARLQLPG
ncbi:HAMP domain-containing histidine kinase [Pseudomonas silvicola]|nr:HAMP domain-containing histidine kinase [Pseudomonas silvicola]